MAATVSVVTKTVFGNKRVTIADVTLDSSYATGGESVTPAQLGLNKVQFANGSVSSGGYVPRYDISASKVMAFMGDNNNASDGPLIEAASTTDLSAVTFRLLAVGY